MAHQVETLAYSGEVPWHGLGVAVAPTLTPQEILVEAGLDWTVSRKPLFYKDDAGIATQVKGTEVLVRDVDDKQLSVVGHRWSPIQNHEAFEIFDDFVKAGGMSMECAGSLREGKLVWALAKTTEEFAVFGDDVIQGYFLFSNPHEYGRVALFGGTSVRVVCNNTHSWALSKGLDNEVRIGHRKAFDVEVVKDAIAALHQRLEEFREMAEALGKKRVKDDLVKKYFGHLFPFTGQDDTGKKLSRNAENALEVIEKQPGAEFAPNSWWQAYNAYTFMTDHVIGNSADNRLNSAWFGYYRRKKAEALDLALEYADAA